MKIIKLLKIAAPPALYTAFVIGVFIIAIVRPSGKSDNTGVLYPIDGVGISAEQPVNKNSFAVDGVLDEIRLVGEGVLRPVV